MENVRCWVPMWRTCSMLVVCKAEEKVLENLTKLLGVREDLIETMLDIKGRKTLRIKIVKVQQYGVPLFDYLFFGPFVLTSENLFLSETTISSDSKIVTNIFTPIEKVIPSMKEAIKSIYSARMIQGLTG